MSFDEEERRKDLLICLYVLRAPRVLPRWVKLQEILFSSLEKIHVRVYISAYMLLMTNTKLIKEC